MNEESLAKGNEIKERLDTLRTIREAWERADNMEHNSQLKQGDTRISINGNRVWATLSNEQFAVARLLKLDELNKEITALENELEQL